MADKKTKIFINHIDRFDPCRGMINYTEEDGKRFMEEAELSKEDRQKLKEFMNKLLEGELK